MRARRRSFTRRGASAAMRWNSGKRWHCMARSRRSKLRHACKLETQAGNARFKKAMLELQGLLIVTHSGATQETESWAYNRFDLVARAFPQQVAQARRISEE